MTGEGYVGDDVHRAARIGAAGHGGQVLVSASTATLVELELADLGEHRFKDLSAPERVYQLGADDFPPLKTLHQTNLPVPPTPFLGRERELGEVLDLLTRDDIRLLTLTGPGGTGKTRLATQAAGALAEHYPHGVWWIPLAALRDPELVLESAAQTLGAKDGLASHIADKRLLLLFDNFEHVLDAASGLAPLLAECPHLEVLVTSREPLHLSAEQEYSVPPFVLEEAVGFFAAKARALEPGFQADEAVPEICRRLDSLPLALELAAARVKALSSRQILERLEQRLPLLTGSSRDAPARQRTLRATIEWSYDLLSPDEQQLFARLSVFAGGCTLEAAEEVCDADLDTLQSLVEKSLLRFADERYWMLETIREYAGERGAADLRGRGSPGHACGLLRAPRGRPLGRGGHGETSGWRGTTRVERDNLLAALEWSLERGDGESSLAIVSGVYPSWFDLRRTRQWAERALALPSERATPRRAASCLALGESAQFTGDHSTAKEAYGEAIAIYRELEDAFGVSVALVQLGDIALEENELDEARRLAEESAAIRRELGGARLGTTAPRRWPTSP